jgi:hypothetical protein
MAIGLLAGLARQAVMDAAKQWGTKGVTAGGNNKAVSPVGPTLGIGGIAAGAGTEYLEHKYDMNIPEITPNGLIGAGMYNAYNKGYGTTTVNVDELVARERALDAVRIQENEKLLK